MAKPKKSQLMKDVDWHISEGENLIKIRTVMWHLKRIEKCKEKIKESEAIIEELDKASLKGRG